MTAKVFAVTHEIPDSHGGLFWSTSKKAAKKDYRSHKAQGYNVAMYEVDVTEMITAALDDNLVGYDPSQYDDATLLKSHTPDPDAGAWEGPRSAFPNSGLYMEYTESGDHWGFDIRKSSPLNWEVFSMGEKVGHVELQPNEFPTFMSFDARGVLLNTHVEFNVAVKTVAAISAGIKI